MSNARVSTSSFRNIATVANPIAISNTIPNGIKIPKLLLLVPSWNVIVDWKASGKTPMDWEIYSRKYKTTLATRLHELSAIGVISGATFTDALVSYFNYVADYSNVSELTLICYEGKDNPHCHRKLLYSWLPESMKGICE